MNILFLTISSINSYEDEGIYTDLMREFIHNGHNVITICPIKDNDKPSIINSLNSKIIKIDIGQVVKNKNLIKKGINTLLLENKYIKTIKKYFNDIKFELIIYSTPPITLYRAIKFIKNRDNAITYLMLKDIFPQNAVDLGIMKKNGIKGFIYKYFRKKETKLYKISDYIGCMSQANCDYLIKYNKYLNESKINVLPNSIDVENIKHYENISKIDILEKYNLPNDKTIFIYGGNLGKPQDVSYIIKCLKNNENKNDRYFLICGNGSDYYKFEEYIKNYKPKNVKIINGLMRNEYEKLLFVCDIGLIFLDHRFTIPNFPSRLLSYMKYKKPVIACTDKNTDIGKVIKEGDFGYWCESNDINNFTNIIDKICKEKELKNKGENAFKYLKNNFNVKDSYKKIIDIIKKDIII